MDNERQQSNLGRWVMLHVMLGFVGLSIFSLAYAIKSPDPVVFKVLDGDMHYIMSDGSRHYHRKGSRKSSVMFHRAYYTPL